MTGKLFRYVSAFSVGLVLAAFLLAIGWPTESKQDLFCAVSDACLAPAILYLGISALRGLAHTGAYDMLTYCFHKLTQPFRNEHTPEPCDATYFTYIQSRKRRTFRHWPLLYTGLVFFILSVLFSVLYCIAS